MSGSLSVAFHVEVVSSVFMVVSSGVDAFVENVGSVVMVNAVSSSVISTVVSGRVVSFSTSAASAAVSAVVIPVSAASAASAVVIPVSAASTRITTVSAAASLVRVVVVQTH